MISTAKIYLLPIFGFDVVGYSRRTTPEQANVQRIWQNVCDRTLRGLDAEILEHYLLNQGDGGIIALQGDVQLAPRFLSRFAYHLNDENKGRGEAQVDMRYALHFGIVRVEEERRSLAISGDGINDLARLLDGMPHDCPGQVVISDEYKRILTDEAEMNAKHFQIMPDICDKHGNAHKVWNFQNDDAGVLVS